MSSARLAVCAGCLRVQLTDHILGYSRFAHLVTGKLLEDPRAIREHSLFGGIWATLRSWEINS